MGGGYGIGDFINNNSKDMETEEFENVKVAYIPSIDTLGIVALNGRNVTLVYSTRFSLIDGHTLVVNKISSDETILCKEVFGNSKLHLINEILNGKFSSCIRRYFKSNSEVSEEKLPKPFIDLYLSTVKNQINKNKNKTNSKSMETKKIFIPFYLEYVGSYIIQRSLGGFEGLLFKKVDNTYVFVYRKDESRTIYCREFGGNELFSRRCERDPLIQRMIWKTIMSWDFSDLEFKFFYWSEDGSREHVLNPYDKNQYLLAILNCIDMNFSHKSIITNRVSNLWGELRENDLSKFRHLEDYKNGLYCELGYKMYKSLSDAIGGHDSDEIYKHFRDCSMKEKIDFEKIECIRDIEDRINFVKLNVVESGFDGDFDLVGLKDRGNGEFTLVIREITKSDLNSCRYISLSYEEKCKFVCQLIDSDTNFTLALIQGRNGNLFENTETNDLDKYLGYIEKVIDAGFESDEESEDESQDNNQNGFIVDAISNKIEKIKERIEGDCRKYINIDSYSPIISSLSAINTYLSFLESRK